MNVGGITQTQTLPEPAKAGRGRGTHPTRLSHYLQSPYGASLGPKPSGSIWKPEGKGGGRHHRDQSRAWAASGKRVRAQTQLMFFLLSHGRDLKDVFPVGEL